MGEQRGFEIIDEPGHKKVKAWTRGVTFDDSAREQLSTSRACPSSTAGWR